MVADRKRWLLNTVLIVSLISFVGLSIAPMLTSFLKQPPSATGPKPGAATPGVDRKQLEDQVKGYESVLQREPENQAALRGLVEVKLQLGDVKGTIPSLEKLAQLNPGQNEYGVLLAQVKQQTGDREGAAKNLRDILANQPGDLKALQGLVALMLQQNRPTAAIGVLQDTLKMAPQLNETKPGSIDTASVQLILGQVYAEQKRYDEALSLYDEVQKASPEDFRPLLAKAIILKTQGNPETEFKPLFDSAAKLAPSQYKDQIQQLAQNPAAGLPTSVEGGPAVPAASPEAGTPPASPTAESTAPTFAP